MRNACALAAILVFALPAVYAGDEGAPQEPPKVVVRERTVYVPYEKLKETFEKEGRGVFLPYEEFLKLWNAGQPKEKPIEEIKPPADAVISGGSYVGVAKETAVRFEVTYKVRALGKNWSELELPLEKVAVETVTLSDPQAVFAPNDDGYKLLLPHPGEYTLTLAFSVRVDSKPGQRRIEFGIPPTAVSRLELLIPEKDLRIEVTPNEAATIATPEGNSTRLLAFVGNADEVAVTWMPPAGAVEKGETILIASQAMHVELGERILRLATTLEYKIERNEDDAFRVRLPAEMRLLSVKGNNIREWTTDNGVLLVRLHSPAKDSFTLQLRFERVLETTPEKLDVPFPVAIGALREDGYITLAHEAGLRVRVENSSGLSQIDPRELPEALQRANLLAGFRYLAHPLSLSLRIEAVQPQIQSAVTAVESLGLEEDGLAGSVDYTIAKVGIFTARLKFDKNWEVTSVGEPQTVEDFQTAVDGASKVLTVNLKNKALGAFHLPFKLTRSGRATPGQVVLEPIQVLDTQQDKGTLGVSAPKAFKLTTVERNRMTSSDVRLLVASGLLAQLPADFELPLAYAYNQQPASVKVALERRQTEIRATGYHTVIVSESGMELLHRLDYFIEFAGVDRLSYSLPSTLDEKSLDVKCPGFKEKRKTGEQNGRSTWEILLQDKVLGSVPVSISHKQTLKGLEPEKPQEVAIPDVRAEEVKQQQGYLAIRKESVLEIEAKPVNLEAIEPVNLPAEMRSSNVYLAFRYFQPERSLALKLTRHLPLELTTTVVDLMRLTFVVSDEKTTTVRAELWVENAKGGQDLELALPKKAVIRALAVNGVSASPLQRQGGGTLVKLAGGARPFPVQLVYAVENEGKLGWLGGLEVTALEVLGKVPVNKIEAELYVPEDYSYLRFSGNLHPLPTYESQSNTLNWILNAADGQREPVVVEHGDSNRFPATPPLLGVFTTQGRLFRFQTLAPVASVATFYCDRKLFRFVDALVFAVALGAAWYFVNRKKWPRLWVSMGWILIPLCGMWFVTGDGGEPLAAWLVAGAAVAAASLFSRVRESWRDWRMARLAMAPDPFLEEAPENGPKTDEPQPPREPPPPAAGNPPGEEGKGGAA